MARFYIILALSFLVICVANTPSAEAAELDFKTPLSGEENMMTNSSFYKVKANNWLKQNKDKLPSVIMAKPPCPSRWWGYYGNFDAETKWRRKIKEDLKGWPQTTIDYCTEVAYVIVDGQVTQHPTASDAMNRTTGSLFIKNKKSDEFFIINVIQENDYNSKKSGGNIYNQKLEKVCEFKFVNQTDDAVVKCIGIGTIAAKVELISFIGGKYRVFGENDSAIMLGSNLSIEETKEKYPHLFRIKTDKKCTFNCGSQPKKNSDFPN